MTVDLNELNYIDSVIVAEDNSILTLGNKENLINQMFGYNFDNTTGTLKLQSNNQVAKNPNEELDNIINKQIQQSKDVINNIRENNKDTKLTDQEILNLYNNFGNDGFLLF